MRLPLLDESVRFSCGSCTACCDQPWRTMIEVDKAQALDRHDFSHYPQLAGKSFYRKPTDGRKGTFELGKGEGTRCLFLDSDGLCIIHKELGPQAKPNMCRQFPILPVRTPVDDRVSVNFGCPSVQHQSGLALADQTDEIASVIPKTQRPVDSEASIALDMKRRLTAAQGAALIDRAIALFEDHRAADVWTPFAELLAMLNTMRSGESPKEIGGESSPDVPASPSVVAFDNPAAAPMPARMLFAATLFPDTVPADSTGRTGLIQRLMQIPKLMTLATLSGGYASRLLGQNLSITQVMQHEIDAELEPQGTALLLRYYRSRFWQRMIVGTKLPIIGGVHQHICDLNAILFLARAEATARNVPTLSADLIRQALTRVEFHLANQVRLYDHTLSGWFKTQLCNPDLAVQSLRLMALRRTAKTHDPFSVSPAR